MRKRKVEENDIRTQKKSRAKYNPPEGLSRLISLANQVLPDKSLPDIYGIRWDRLPEILKSTNIFDETREVAEISEETQKKELLERLFLESLKKYPEIFADILVESALNVGYSVQSSNPYEYLASPEVVDEFIDLYSTIQKDIAGIIILSKDFNDIRKGIKDLSTLNNIDLPLKQFVFDSDIFTFEESTPLHSIIEAGINPTRLRRCEICDHIFWARYKNSETCSIPCRSASRERRFRKNNKEAINKRRRLNHAHKVKKRTKYCEKCAHPKSKYECYTQCNFPE